MNKSIKDYSKNNVCTDCGILIQNRSKRCHICYAQNYLRPLHIKRQQEKYKNVLISQQANQILLGSLLGDGALSINKYSPSFRETHGLKQRKYLNWKRKLLKLPSRQFILIRKNHPTIKNYQEICYQTRYLPQLLQYYHLFYPNNKKIVTREILDKLKPLGLAVWYMDDGGYSSNANVSIYTNCFSYNEQIIIKEWFQERWDIKIWITKDKKKYHVGMGKSESNKFLEIVKPFIHKIMKYKTIYDPDVAKKYHVKQYLHKKLKNRCLICGINNCIGKACKTCYTNYQINNFIRDINGRFISGNSVNYNITL